MLILDEATSALDVATRDRLFAILRGLSREGIGIIIITHRMDEVETIGDSVTVLRSGSTVASLARGTWTRTDLVRLMTGSNGQTEGARKHASRSRAADAELVLSTEGLRLTEEGRPIDIEIHAGELIGLAGLEGHGQDAFLAGLSGSPIAGGSVIRHIADRQVQITSRHDAAQAGIAYVPKERRAESLFEWMSIRDNFALPTLKRDTHLGLVNHRGTLRRFVTYRDRLKHLSSDICATLSAHSVEAINKR